MKILRFFLIVLFCSPVLLLSQIEEDVDLKTLNKDTIRLIKETSEGTMIVELNDLEDLSDQRIDSLITILDKKTASDSSNIYGHSLFKNKFELVDNNVGNSIVKTPDNYRLGYGDEISVSIFGVSQFLGKYLVDSKGFIYPEEIPSIYLFGMELGQAKEVIRKTFSRYFIFRKDQISISLGSPRDILVNVFGEVKKPGSYNISALNTSFQALFNAGGPNKTGSVRNIKVITDGFESRLDIYELMSNPLSNVDLIISDNTLINVPVAEKIVRIEGAVVRPMSYELKENEGFLELLHYAGGLASNAYLKSLSIKRFEVDRMRVLDIDLQSVLKERKNITLQNGDVITIKSISSQLNEVVSVEGAVSQPGFYDLESTPRIGDLLDKAQLLREARKDNIFIKRNNPDGTTSILTVDFKELEYDRNSSMNISLFSRDEVVVDSLSMFTDKHTIKVAGAVRRAIEHSYDVSGTMTVRSALNLAGGPLSDASEFGYILRSDPLNKTNKKYIRFNLNEMVDPSLGKADLVLQPNDELIILSNSESDDKKIIEIAGAVRKGSIFQYAPNLELRDLILFAGGLKPEASGKVDIYRTTFEQLCDSERTIVLKVNLDEELNPNKKIELLAGDKIIVRTIEDFVTKAFVRLKGEFNQTGQFALINNNERVSDLIERAGGLTSEAFMSGAFVLRDSTKHIVLDLDAIKMNPKSGSDYFLQHDDIIVVPKIQNLVYINIENSLAGLPKENEILGVPFVEGKRADWYFEQYAGGSAFQKSNDIELLVSAPNGGVKRTQKRWLLRDKHPLVPLGSTISYRMPQTSDLETHEANGNLPKFKKGVIINLDKNMLESHSNKDDLKVGRENKDK